LQMLAEVPSAPQSEPKWQQKLADRIAKLTGKTKNKPVSSEPSFSSSSLSNLSDSVFEERLKKLRGEETDFPSPPSHLPQAGENNKSQNSGSEEKISKPTVEKTIVSDPKVNKKSSNWLFWFIFFLISSTLISGLYKIGEILCSAWKKLIFLFKKNPKTEVEFSDGVIKNN
jgi:hypothetical protein